MTRTLSNSLWLISLLLLSVTAGFSWAVFDVTEDAGGGNISISGFEAFPVIGTFIGMQLVSIIAGLLVSPVFRRVIAAVLSGFAVWVFLDVLINRSERLSNKFIGILAERTGIITDPNLAGLSLATGNLFSQTLFLICVCLNLGALLLVAIISFASARKPRSDQVGDLPEDLWSNQK